MTEVLRGLVWLSPICPSCKCQFETPWHHKPEDFELLKSLREATCPNCSAVVLVKFVEEQR